MEGLEKYMDESNFGESDSESIETNTSEVSSIDENSSESENDNSEEKELSLEDQLNSFTSEDGEKKEGGSSLLDELNQLGLIRQGLPIEFDEIDKVKEYLSKGFDYTAKTQELAEQRKEFEAKQSGFQEEYQAKLNEVEEYRISQQEKLTENEIMAQVLQELQTSEPDLFQMVAGAYNQRMNLVQMQNNSPMVKGFNDKISNLEKQLQANQKTEISKENEGILQKWDTELSDVQSAYATKLRKLGVKPNWEKVKSVWSNDATNKTSVKDAFFAIHGEQITKALDAQSKLNATKAKSALRSGPENNNVKNTSDQKESKFGSGTYLSDLEEIAKRYI